MTVSFLKFPTFENEFIGTINLYMMNETKKIR